MHSMGQNANLHITFAFSSIFDVNKQNSQFWPKIVYPVSIESKQYRKLNWRNCGLNALDSHLYQTTHFFQVFSFISSSHNLEFQLKIKPEISPFCLLSFPITAFSLCSFSLFHFVAKIILFGWSLMLILSEDILPSYGGFED